MSKSSVHYSSQLLRSIVLDFCVNVHSYLALLMSGEILNRFRVNRGIYQVGDICMPELMWCHLKIQTVHNLAVMARLLSKYRTDRFGDPLPIDISHISAFFRGTSNNVLPHSLELGV